MRPWKAFYQNGEKKLLVEILGDVDEAIDKVPTSQVSRNPIDTGFDTQMS